MDWTLEKTQTVPKVYNGIQSMDWTLEMTQTVPRVYNGIQESVLICLKYGLDS